MKSKSLSLAKTALLVSLGIGLISAWYSWQTTQDMPALQQAVRAANKKATEAVASNDELQKLAPVSGELQPIDTALSGFMLALMNSRTRYGVEVSQAAPAKGGGSDKTQIATLAEDIPGVKSIKSLKVEIQGSYSDYERFTAFLSFVRDAGAVSIVHLRVKDNTYALSIRIHGKA